MNVLANDGLDKEGIKLFQEAGIGIDAEKRDLDCLVKEIVGFDGLIVRSATKVSKEIIESGSSGELKIIGRAGVGYDNIDVNAASQKGIIVKFAPYGNTNSTAELALTLMLNVSRNIPQAHYSLKNGIWMKKPFKGTELSHKTLGIIGCGRVGQRLSELVRGFDMEIIGYDQFIDNVKANYHNSRIKYLPKEEILTSSDYVSIHTGGRDKVIGSEELSLMKKTAYLINAARGNLIDEEALYCALSEKKIAGAALDVYADEPKEEGAAFSNKLKQLDNVVLSPHLGASTKEAQRETSLEIARVVIDYLLAGDFSNSVNASESIDSERRQVYKLFVHHRDVPGVFAKIDNVLSENGINIRETSSRQIGNDGSAVTVYLVHKEIKQEIIESLNRLDMVYNVKV